MGSKYAAKRDGPTSGPLGVRKSRKSRGEVFWEKKRYVAADAVCAPRVVAYRLPGIEANGDIVIVCRDGPTAVMRGEWEFYVLYPWPGGEGEGSAWSRVWRALPNEKKKNIKQWRPTKKQKTKITRHVFTIWSISYAIFLPVRSDDIIIRCSVIVHNVMY